MFAHTESADGTCEEVDWDKLARSGFGQRTLGVSLLELLNCLECGHRQQHFG
jgi:hypothetical protein